MPRPRAATRRAREACDGSSLRLALKRLRAGPAAPAGGTRLGGGFDLEGTALRVGGDRYRLVRVPGEGDCAFDSMAYLVHALLNRREWTTPADAYAATGLTSAWEVRKALDQYRTGFPREGRWGDQFDWVVFSAMFGVRLDIVSYRVTEEGFGGETHSVITPETLGARAFVPPFVRVDRDALHAGLSAYLCNHNDVHYDPMVLVERR